MPDKPMTFEEWKASKEHEEFVIVFQSLQAASTEGAMDKFMTLLERTAWARGERRQMHLDHKAEMERLKT